MNSCAPTATPSDACLPPVILPVTAPPARRTEGNELALHVAELSPVGHGAGDAARPERDGVRGVRGDRRDAGEEERRKRDEAPAAGDRVDGATDDGGEE